MLGIGEAEWSTLLEDQSLLEPATSTENKLLEAFSSGGGKENVSTAHGTDGENSCQTSTKRLKLSLSRRKPSKTTEVKAADLKDCTNTAPNSSRFSKLVSSPEREKASKGVIPANTAASSQWALRNFNEWSTNRSLMAPDDPVPADLLQSHDPELVCKWLCRFVIETRKTDGSPYPPSTLRSLISGLNRVLQSNQAPFSVLDKGDYRFRNLLKTLDSLSSELHSAGIGASKNSAKVIEVEDENMFWQKGILGYSTPKILQRTVFFYVGHNFVLRGIQEQYDLVISQFTRVPQDTSVYNQSVYYEYTEFISKNNQHRFKFYK